MATAEQIKLLENLKVELKIKDVWTKGQVIKLIDDVLINYLLNGNGIKNAA